MKFITAGITIFALACFSASAAERPAAQTRDEALAEAMSHADHIITEYPDMTLITEISGGALTVYKFSKPSNAGYPGWAREKIFPGGKREMTRVGSERRTASGTFEFIGNWNPDDSKFADEFLKLTSQTSN